MVSGGGCLIAWSVVVERDARFFWRWGRDCGPWNMSHGRFPFGRWCRCGRQGGFFFRDLAVAVVVVAAAAVSDSAVIGSPPSSCGVERCRFGVLSGPRVNLLACMFCWLACLPACLLADFLAFLFLAFLLSCWRVSFPFQRLSPSSLPASLPRGLGTPLLPRTLCSLPPRKRNLIEAFCYSCPVRLLGFALANLLICDAFSFLVVRDHGAGYLSRVKNQHGHWVFWMSAGRKNGVV